MTKFEITKFPPLKYEAAEAINTLCANLSFAGGDIKKIMVTSCNPQDGKSFVSMYLMQAFAALGMRVLLIDADIRASSLLSSYAIRYNRGEYKGLTRYLAGRADMDQIIAETNIPNAHMILVGKTVKNSFPLMKSARFKVLLDSVTRQYDIIIIDAPPIGTIIDPALIAEHCDGILLMVRSGFTTKKELKTTIHQIERTGCPILGTVLNGFDAHQYGKSGYYHKNYYSNYYQYYGGSDKKKRKKRTNVDKEAVK